MSKPRTPEQRSRKAEYMRQWAAAHPPTEARRQQTAEWKKRQRAEHPDHVHAMDARYRLKAKAADPEGWAALDVSDVPTG